MNTPIEEVVGPPGTGKTTYLASEARRALARDERVAIVSLTRTAAAAVLSKNIRGGVGGGYGGGYGDDEDLFVGTFHRAAIAALGKPTLAATYIEEFNQEYPNLATYGGGDVDTPLHYEPAGDDVIAEYNRQRAAGVALDDMPVGVQNGARVYEAWKAGNTDNHGPLVDFQDVIERATEETDTMPGAPDVLFLDETQDFSPAEVKLAEHWSRNVSRCVAVGDPDQCIFGWRGADPFALEKIGAVRVGVLEQSYRLPRAVHRYSQDKIRKVSKRNEAPFAPRDADGVMRYIPTASPNYPSRIVAEIAADFDRLRFNDRYQPATYMILTTCAYQLEKTVEELKAAGLPFHNPYRPRQGLWNPIPRRRGTVSYLDRLAAFGSGVWRGEYVRKWVEMVKLDQVFKKPRPPREWFKSAEYATEADFLQSLTDEARGAWIAGDYAWLESPAVMLSQFFGRDRYPRRILEARGITEAERRPRITIGTIHSVKGGEADVVYVMPELSQIARESFDTSTAGRDAQWRTWYVGFTRAREELVVCGVGK